MDHQRPSGDITGQDMGQDQLQVRRLRQGQLPDWGLRRGPAVQGLRCSPQHAGGVRAEAV
ncbi:hypothetical protein LINGRAHAP2_LOCUS3263 [Linum grandiflorum]